MVRIFIEPVKAKKVLPEYAKLERLQNGLCQEVKDIRSGLNYRIGGQDAISARLKEAAEQLNQEAAGIRALCLGLEQAIAQYERTEGGNLERVAAEKLSVQWAGNAQAPVDYPKFDVEEFLKEELSELLGPAGILVSLWDGDKGKISEDLIELIGDTGSVILDKPRADWFQELFGFGADGFERMEEAPGLWDDVFDFSTEGKTVGTVANWGASFLGSFMSNADEFGADGWTQGRFWEETLVETGINVVEGAVITHVVGAGAVALFGNPVSLGVAAATVAATFAADWVLDTAITWITGGSQTSWTEWASDGICNGLEWAGGKISEGLDQFVDHVGPVVTKAVDTVKDGVGYVADKVSAGLNSVKEGISDFFSGCRWGRAAVSGGW